MSDENRSANISEEPGAISVQARMEQPPLPPVFGHVPDHINLHFDLESGILDDLEARYPYLVIQRAGVDFDILPEKSKQHTVDDGWTITQMGKDVLAMSAGEYAWVDFASIDMHQGQVQPVVIGKRQQALPYFVMKDQPCQIQSLLGAGIALSIPSLEWSCAFEGQTLSPEWTPSQLGLHAIVDGDGQKIGDLMVCEPKVLPPRQGTLQSQADKTIDAMVEAAKTLGWEEIRVRGGDQRSLFSLWVAGKQQEVMVNEEDVGYTPYFEQKLAVIMGQKQTNNPTPRKKTK